MADMNVNSPHSHLSSIRPSMISNESVIEVNGLILKSEQDTICSAEEKNSSAPLPTRVVLEQGNSQEKDYLAILAKAFCDVYSTLSTTTVVQADDLASLQSLDQEMSLANLNAIGKAIQAQDVSFGKQQVLNAKIQHQIQQQKVANIFGWVVGGVFIALTVASSFIDFGASLTALPEELELEGGASSGAASNGATSASNGAASSTGATSSSNATTSAVNGNDPDALMRSTMQEMKSTMQQPSSQQFSMQDQINEIIDRENNPRLNNTSSWEKAREALGNRWLKRCVGFGTSVAMSTPQFMKGVADIQVANYKKKYIVPTLKAVGKALGEMQKVNYYFQFFQQQVQRQSGVVEEFMSQLSDVVELAGNVMSAYRQIPYGLAQAA